ncbi:MAG TPA: SCO5389 family protein [Actinophytocola sp.]|uniref:SCO5389 family protein n=1 Tax=Actinophytocola sp. TaxID=1872138 RepID=UPI002DBD0F5B|nr:SCO5389 family protein [Actinophytocola sp.]HEU5470847.1 SCO5389 family protein [Actinophytocola sp.]
MSLNVSTALLDRASSGQVPDEPFVACVRDSLPYAWAVIESVATTLHNTPGIPFADNTTPPPTETDRGQLLRALASDAIRGALERHFAVTLAFQNCHRVAAFHPGATDSPAYQEFTSPRSQLLNQSPELRNC